jgi:hypothetical protein
MLHVIYLMHPGGVCLLEQKFGSLELDSNLVSGFFSAIKDFSRILSKGAGEARIVEMGQFYVTYASGDLLVVAAVVDKDDNRVRVLHALDEVIQQFTARFGEVLKEWDGKLVFFSFTPELTKLLNSGFVGETPEPRPLLKRGLPKLMVKLGQISEEEYRVAAQCNGNRSPEEIAELVNLPQDDVEVLLYKLGKLDLIK